MDGQTKDNYKKITNLRILVHIICNISLFNRILFDDFFTSNAQFHLLRSLLYLYNNSRNKRFKRLIQPSTIEYFIPKVSQFKGKLNILILSGENESTQFTRKVPYI